MADADFFEQIKLSLPKYLTPKQKEDLFSELSKFPENYAFYLSNAAWAEQLLQGDGWRGFVAINFTTGEQKTVSGVIVSNSCDIAPDNVRDLPANVLFSPLIELSRYADQLRAVGKSAEQIASLLEAIRKQRVTSMFYLPEHPGICRESIILLHDIHAHPLPNFLGTERTCLFTLNQFAFYLFLIKLSIHFARFQEGVQRFDQAA
jgi:hypothetical protein